MKRPAHRVVVRWAGVFCIVLPLAAAIWFWPPSDAGRMDSRIAIWGDVVLRLSATSLSLYRFVLTFRDPDSIENTFQMVAPTLSFLFGGKGLQLDPDDRVPALDLLAGDRAAVVSVLVIVVTLVFIASRRRRPNRPTA